MKSRKFKEDYERLNTGQKQAVDAIEGPVMVIAGPGTGKTQILTLRIANILQKTDTTADSILALTFTKSGVYSMRRRLVDFIGSAAYSVNIHTFHSFCNEVIKDYPEEFPRIIGSNDISDIDQIRIVEDILSESKFTKLKLFGDPFFFVKDILHAIRTLKRENYSPLDFAERVKKDKESYESVSDKIHSKGKFKGEVKGEYRDWEKNIEKNEELASAYAAYEEALTEKHFYDYEDMILEVVRTLEKNKSLLLRLEERYQYLLADEHQDANQAQNRLLELLSSYHESPNLFIVGDEKQAIYRFQGASLENFLYFKKKFKDATLVNLTENYRSTQTILDAAGSLMKKRKNAGEHIELKSQEKHKGKPIELRACPNDATELRFLIGDIQKRIENGENPGNIAVLFRDNKDAEPLLRAFERTNIPFVLESGEQLFDDEDIQKLMFLLRAISDLANDEAVSKVLFLDFLDIPLLDVYKILSFRYKEKYLLSDILSSKKILESLKLSDPKKVLDLWHKLESWARAARNKGLIDFFEEFVRTSGFQRHLLSLPGSIEKLSKLDTLLSEMRKLLEGNREKKLADFLEHLLVLSKYNISLETERVPIFESTVRLMTVHKSKGLEFNTVYIVKVYDGHFGNKRKRNFFKLPIFQVEEDESMEDERRLFYVGLTRARQHVILSYGLTDDNGKQRLPAQFVEEIDTELIDLPDTVEAEDASAFMAEEIPHKQVGRNILDKAYLKELFLEQGLSVSALNNYLSCPWNYFFMNLIRLPQVQSKQQLYGTAVHAALKELFDRMRDGENPTKVGLLSSFERNIRKMPLSRHDFEEMERKGKKALTGYFETYSKSWVFPTLSEYAIGGVFLEVIEEDLAERVLLKGTLDKIEFKDGGVNVVDYKTGKPKSRNDIEGKTKSGTGDYKRQLVFYKLLLDNGTEGRFNFLSGEIDFIEPDDKGKYHKEVFFISPEEVTELKELIRRVSHEILTFTFWDSKCDDKDCEYCDLRTLITEKAETNSEVPAQ